MPTKREDIQGNLFQDKSITHLVIRGDFSSCKSDGHGGRRQNLTTTLFGGRAMTVKTNIKAGMNKTEIVKL